MIHLALIALVVGSPADAPGCANAHAQRDLTRCAVAEFGAADAALNAQYALSLAAMRASDASLKGSRDPRPVFEPTLREAQRAWLVFRDAHCRSEGYRLRGGSAEPMAVNLCLATLTRDRTRQLAALVATAD